MKNLLIQKQLKLLLDKTQVEKWLAISLAFWVFHVFLRALLLFRSDPYGLPFVSKPDWYIFHALALDFLWISKLLVFFFLLQIVSSIVLKHFSLQNNLLSKKVFYYNHYVWFVFYVLLHAILLLFTLLDHEVHRFLGSHLSFGLLNTYSDSSSIKMFWDYVSNDYSVPFLQFFVLVLILPSTFFLYRYLKILFLKKSSMISKTIIGSFVFYIISFLFVHYLWTGNARMTKLRPVVSLVYLEVFNKVKKQALTTDDLILYGKSYQKLWLEIEGDSLWTFIPNKTSPLYKVPVKNINQNDAKEDSKKAPPNFIVVFLESHRALNVGFLNPKLKVSPTPFMDSLSLYSRFWSRMHTSGLPTTGALLSSHIGLPHHSHLAQATDLAHISIPSFASVLSDSGYNTHYFSAADPAWDNLGVWMSKWYQSQHYHRNREDDSTFFKHASSYIKDTLALNKAPFLVTLMTRSNHYPFNFAAGMSSEDKKKPLIERINITMNYTDRQLARFIRSIQNEAWFQNTYLIVLADHGFPLGENGVSTMNGGAFSNATWIPFLIYGEGLEKGEDSRSASQIDIAPTILDLAGISVENFFMGHSLIQNNNGSLSLGAYSNSAAIGYQGYRLITPYPWNQNSHSWLFREEDIYQTQDLSKEKPQIVDKLRATLDTLIRLSDHLLEKGLP